MKWKKSDSFLESLSYAVEGLKFGLKNELNIRRQLLIFLLAVLAGLFFSIPLTHFILLLLTSGVALGVELLNSALEAMADALHPEYNNTIRHAKDLAASASLMVSLAALIIGILIFLPPLIKLVQ